MAMSMAWGRPQRTSSRSAGLADRATDRGSAAGTYTAGTWLAGIAPECPKCGACPRLRELHCFQPPRSLRYAFRGNLASSYRTIRSPTRRRKLVLV